MTKAPDYGRYVARLLEKAEAAPSARPDLEESLERAQVEIFYLEMEEDKPPAELLNQVRNHVAKTIKLMEKLQKYGAYSSFFLSWPRATEDGGRGIITVQEALRDIEQQIGKPKRGNPEKPGQFCAVCEARNFFDRHSPRRPSADEKNPFAEFCELFLRAVSGVAVKEGTLTWAIRGALKQGKEANRRKNAD